jgi:ribosomal protein S18 acetylase RimI-like enzyme
MARLDGSVVEPVGADLVGLAQAHALDASTFPYSSLPVIFGAELPPVLFVARAERGGPVVGFVSLRVRDAALEIAGLAVDPAHRRAGLGRALVKAALRAARQRALRRVTLHVSTVNAEALALYESEGFRRVERLSGFYAGKRFGDGGDAWLMMRRARR